MCVFPGSEAVGSEIRLPSPVGRMALSFRTSDAAGFFLVKRDSGADWKFSAAAAWSRVGFFFFFLHLMCKINTNTSTTKKRMLTYLQHLASKLHQRLAVVLCVPGCRWSAAWPGVAAADMMFPGTNRIAIFLFYFISDLELSALDC